MRSRTTQSEIRNSVIEHLLEKVHKHDYKTYLYALTLSSIRMFANQRVRFDFPVTALIGPNGAGKSTILGACASVYANNKPRFYFRKNRFGDEKMDNWHVM